MAEVQHAGARKVLTLIERTGAHSGELTYKGAAIQMGRPATGKHSRAVAQMCDLLDAAACLAGVPLLALVAIRSNGGQINPKAWNKEFGSARDAIIQRSLTHTFSASDFKSIRSALERLQGLGNRKAWDFVNTTYGELVYRRLLGNDSDQLYSALDDLGTEDPARAFYAGYSYVRDAAVRAVVIARANGRCEHCGEEGFRKTDGQAYLETHHVIALAKEGADKVSNVIALCANDHRRAHFSADRDVIEAEMLSKLKTLNS